MAQNKRLNFQTVALTTSAANYLNCLITTLTGGVGFAVTQPYILLRHIHFANNSATPTTVSFFKGATGGSTLAVYSAVPIAGNGVLDWYGEIRLDSTDFLSALVGAATVYMSIDSAEVGFS